MERKLNRKLEEKQCVICGEIFQPKYYNVLCCSHKCSAIHVERRKFNWKEKYSKKAEPIKKPIFITDEEQKKIDEAVADKFNLSFETKIYENGSEEFNKLAQELIKRHTKY